jgi:hypothetical protein
MRTCTGQRPGGPRCIRAFEKKNTLLDNARGLGNYVSRCHQCHGSAAMLAKVFENGRMRGLILRTFQADWRETTACANPASPPT